MTQFGYIPSSTSPAAKRIEEAGKRYAESLRVNFERQAHEMQQARIAQAVEARRRLISDRRRAVLDRIETAIEIAKALPNRAAPTVTAIMAEVCIEHGVSMADLLGTKRNKKFVRARQHAMWLCHQKTRFSTLRLGKFFQRDHTTVLHAIQAHEARMKGGA